MWLRVVGVLTAVLLTAGAGFVVFTAPGDVAPVGQATVAPPTEPEKERTRQRPRRPTQAPVPTTPPAPPVATPSPTEHAPDSAEARAAARLARLVSRGTVRGVVGVSVTDRDGHEVFSSHAGQSMLPASTQKLAVAAAALVRLGPAHRFTTNVRATAPPNQRGVVKGDLILVGGGDPALGGPAFGSIEPDRPRTPLERLATRIKKSGVRRVTGRILGDPSFLAHEPIAAGWPPRYFEQLDATRISGLTVDAGRRLYRVGPYLRAKPASEPARQACLALRQLLRARGVKVAGGVRVMTRPAHGSHLASISSPPVGRLLQYMVQRSDNHLADTIFRAIGASGGSSTWVGAAGATADALAPLQLDWSNTVLADGSGLSRANRVTPRFLAQLQARLWRSNLQPHWVRLLAVTGHSGTLRYRLRGTVAQQRVYGKTGSLRDVTALVGTVIGTRERTLHFAIVGNRLQSTSQMRTLTDRAVLAMAEELQDCRRVRRPVHKGKNKRPRAQRVRLVCDTSG